MPRSSRHKSSKHSSRDARDYSDSEKDSSSKDRKSKEESSAKVSKESGFGEKRKLDSKDNKDSFVSGNGEYLEEYSISKRRKEKNEDGVNDRWNRGDDDRGEGTKKLKEKSSESKSKRRDDSAGAYGEIDEIVKKSSGKNERKHRESSSRKEDREGGAERERDREREKEKERDGEDMRALKQLSEKTELSARDLLQSSESENLPDRRMRRKRDGSGDGDKHQDDIGDNNDRCLSSREDIIRDGRPKDEKHKDEKYRDKYHEDVDRENRHRDDKQGDDCAMKDHVSNRSDDKLLRDDKDSLEIRLKKYKPRDGDRDCVRDHDHDHDHDIDFDVGWDHDHESYLHDRERDRDRDGDRDRERDRDHDSDRDWDWDRDRDRDRARERNLDYDGPHSDDRNAKQKDSRGRKRSPDDHDDDYADAKSRGVKTAYLDMEKKSLSCRRVEADNDRGRSQSRQAHADNNASNRRASPNSSSHGAADEFRHFKQELKYRDAGIEHRSKSKEVNSLPGASERNSKYRSSEKLNKMDDGHTGELSLERSSGSKASPMGLVDRSPSSTSLNRRCTNRSGVRRSLDIEESVRRSNARDFPSADDRPNRDLPMEKSLVNDSDGSPFYNRTSQSNSALARPPSAFKGGVGSPSFMEEDGRISSGARYKRSGDPNLGRGQGNAWRGAPNWSSPLPNCYIPFQHGPPHGGFQAMLPHFPSPLFEVRPSMEINHSGIPYHISDGDRLAGHLRPLGWKNLMDDSGPSHMHGWDGNIGLFRDEPHTYGGADWDQNRHSMNCRGWESNADIDIWKGQNGDVNLDLPSTLLKEDFPMQASMDDISAGQGGQRLRSENKCIGFQAKTVETKTVTAPSGKDSYKSSLKTLHEKTPDPTKSLSNDRLYHAYLSMLDISTELADPQLYDQLVSLLDREQSVNAGEDVAMLVNLKDGAKAVPKCSSILLSSSLFPATSNSVFQRAMGIYKRDKASVGGLPITNGGTIDVILASKVEEEVYLNKDASEELVSNHNGEMSDVNMSDLNEMKVEIVPAAAVQEISEVTPSQKVDVDVDAPDLQLESSREVLSHDIVEKPLTVASGDEKEAIPLNLANPEAESVPSPGGVPNTANDLSNDAHNTDEMKGSSDALNSGEDREGFGEAKCDALILLDDSPKVSGALKPESESVILSRIHHSPESTR